MFGFFKKEKVREVFDTEGRYKERVDFNDYIMLLQDRFENNEIDYEAAKEGLIEKAPVGTEIDILSGEIVTLSVIEGDWRYVTAAIVLTEDNKLIPVSITENIRIENIDRYVAVEKQFKGFYAEVFKVNGKKVIGHIYQQPM